jgi:hypothetical protein
MNHAITLGGLLLFLAAAGGLVAIALGALTFFAGSMSDSPAAGDAAGKQGCIILLVGLAVFVGSLWGLLS